MPFRFVRRAATLSPGMLVLAALVACQSQESTAPPKTPEPQTQSQAQPQAMVKTPTELPAKNKMVQPELPHPKLPPNVSPFGSDPVDAFLWETGRLNLPNTGIAGNRFDAETQRRIQKRYDELLPYIDPNTGQFRNL